MATLIFFVLFLGFWLLYSTSKKAILEHSSPPEKWIQAHAQYTKLFGLFLFGLALAASIAHFGIGSGIFAFFVMLMAAGSIIVILAPVRIVNYKLVSSLFVFFFLSELILN